MSGQPCRRPRTSPGRSEQCILGRACSSGQRGGGCGKGFTIMGVAPKSREGTARRAPGFPRRLRGNFPTLRHKAAWDSWRDPRPTHKLAACASPRGPGLASCRRPPPPPRPSSSPPPRRYLSLRGTRRAAAAAASTRSPTPRPWPISAEPEAPPRASRSPGGSSRGQPNRTEPSRAEPSRGRRAREAAARSPGELVPGGPG